MEATQPTLLLVVVVAMALHSVHADNDCWNTYMKVKKKPAAVANIEGLNSTKVLYVIPEQGFRGVILQATIGSEVHNATFSFSEQCYYGSGSKWNELRVSVTPLPSAKDPGGTVQVEIGQCGGRCYWSVLTSASELTILCDGNSKWTNSLRETCDINKVALNQDYNEGSCTAPPYNANTPLLLPPPPPPPPPRTTTTITTTVTAAASTTTTATTVPTTTATPAGTVIGSGRLAAQGDTLLVLERVSYVVVVVVVVVVVGVVGMLVKELLRLPPPTRLEVVPLPALPGGARGATAAAAQSQEEAQITVNEVYEPTTSRADHHHHHHHHHQPAARHDSVHSVINQNYHH